MLQNTQGGPKLKNNAKSSLNSALKDSKCCSNQNSKYKSLHTVVVVPSCVKLPIDELSITINFDVPLTQLRINYNINDYLITNNSA